MFAGSELPASVEFGPFRVLPHRRELLANGHPVKLGGRAFDVLMALLEARGAVISKDALMARVWPGRIAGDNNLQTHISALRAVLGPDRDLIRTVSGRGYQFIGEIRPLTEDPGEERVSRGPYPAESGTGAPTNLPEPVSELIARDDELAEVINLLGAHRLVTLTGAGGIGKTRLALAVGLALRPRFANGVWLAQFSTLADPALVPATIAAAVRLELGGQPSVQSVAQALASRSLLLVLDTCEHVIEVAASMAEAALGSGSGVRILVTSREPLRADGEWVYPVPPLPVPAANAETEDPFEYGAIRLFLERARAAEPHFSLDGPLAEFSAAICRRLDGIPLAIELAAARAPALGVKELAARLDDRFRLLIGGLRTALPRHQTLRATLDWSYELLDEPERALLRQLSVFAGAFALNSARLVVTNAELSASAIDDGITSLIAKSLVQMEGTGLARYRLLDTTRAYAREKLESSGELPAVAHRHAQVYRELIERAEAEWETRPVDEWPEDYRWRIDNLRVALDWAFSQDGDASIGVALTAAAIPLWLLLSLIEECRDRVERALVALTGGAAQDARREMKLRAALGASLTYTGGATVAEIDADWTKALDLAAGLDDPEYQLRSLWGLWFFCITTSRHRVALEFAARFCALAEQGPDAADRLVNEYMIGIAQHLLGDQEDARGHLEHALDDGVNPYRGRQIVRFQIDQAVMARGFLARVLWLQGFPDRAMRTAESSVAAALASNHVTSLCHALSHAACPVALWIGNLAAAEHYVGMLLDHSTRYALTRYHAFGRVHEGVLAVKRGDGVTGELLLRTGFDELKQSNAAFRSFPFLGEMAEALGCTGRFAEGLGAVEQAIAWSNDTEERCEMAELLRLKGELVFLEGAPGAAMGAEDSFQQALDWAHRQDALSWELRAATSLARLWRDQGRSGDARAVLQPVYDRFTEGFDTTDLRIANALLDDL